MEIWYRFIEELQDIENILKIDIWYHFGRYDTYSLKFDMVLDYCASLHDVIYAQLYLKRTTGVDFYFNNKFLSRR